MSTFTSSEEIIKAMEARIDQLQEELRRLQSVVCEEDYEIIQELLDEPNTPNERRV